MSRQARFKYGLRDYGYKPNSKGKPMIHTPNHVELSPVDYEKMHKVFYELYGLNPAAYRGVVEAIKYVLEPMALPKDWVARLREALAQAEQVS